MPRPKNVEIAQGKISKVLLKSGDWLAIVPGTFQVCTLAYFEDGVNNQEGSWTGATSIGYCFDTAQGDRVYIPAESLMAVSILKKDLPISEAGVK